MKSLINRIFGIKFASSSMIRGQYSQGRRDANKTDFAKEWCQQVLCKSSTRFQFRHDLWRLNLLDLLDIISYLGLRKGTSKSKKSRRLGRLESRFAAAALVWGASWMGIRGDWLFVEVPEDPRSYDIWNFLPLSKYMTMLFTGFRPSVVILVFTRGRSPELLNFLWKFARFWISAMILINLNLIFNLKLIWHSQEAIGKQNWYFKECWYSLLSLSSLLGAMRAYGFRCFQILAAQ